MMNRSLRGRPALDRNLTLLRQRALCRPATPEQALLARANSLLKDRDISGARLMLERALQAGSSRAAFQLAETYDPRQLSRWRVHGVQGDWAKAQALYQRAYDGGIMEAKDRIAPLR